MKTRIANIDHTIRKFAELGDHMDIDCIKVVVGQPSYVEQPNAIIFLYCKNGESNDESKHIETDMCDVTELICIVSMALSTATSKFKMIKATTMDNTELDPENMPESAIVNLYN